jgi:hypothetical protein
MSNIKRNNYRNFDSRIINDKNLDFILCGNNIKPVSSDIKLSAKINFYGNANRHVVSEVAWEGAVASDKTLKNIGFTGVDNGFISYEKDRIANDEFLELFTNSNFDLSSYDKRFFMTEVSGNTGEFVYPIIKNDEYTTLKGGFYQGFFKINGDKYQTLPHTINDEWEFKIVLRRKNYDTPSNILNKRHNDNEGIFLYIGARAENKFWELYKHSDEINEHKIYDDYFVDDYNQSDCECEIDNSIFEDDYIQKDISLDDITLSDSKGNKIGEKGFYEIETDNKFILFNQTKNGFTKKTWKDDYKIILTGKTDTPNINYYPYLNQTKNGYTKDNINQLEEQFTYNYDIFKEIENNALAFKINNDGSITYKFLSDNCEILEETSKPNIIKDNEWADVKIKIKAISNKKMKIYVYINDYLKLVSKELPMLKLKPLNDTPERQETVPFSLSIGGGTQGLCERILLDYNKLPEYILPLEKHFAGSFIGDIKEFVFSTNSQKECEK